MRAFRVGAAQVDLVTIGVGVIGAGIARDAARRGLSVALVEWDDFGGGTTAAFTRLVHGGLRYLAMGDIRLVRLDLRQREKLLRIAPHLVAPLPFLLPLKLGGAMERIKLSSRHSHVEISFVFANTHIPAVMASGGREVKSARRADERSMDCICPDRQSESQGTADLASIYNDATGPRWCSMRLYPKS